MKVRERMGTSVTMMVKAKVTPEVCEREDDDRSEHERLETEWSRPALL